MSQYRAPELLDFELEENGIEHGNLGLLYYHRLTLISAWISNHMNNINVGWNYLSLPKLQLCYSHFIMDVIIYLCPDLKLIYVSKMGSPKSFIITALYLGHCRCAIRSIGQESFLTQFWHVSVRDTLQADLFPWSDNNTTYSVPVVYLLTFLITFSFYNLYLVTYEFLLSFLQTMLLIFLNAGVLLDPAPEVRDTCVHGRVAGAAAGNAPWRHTCHLPASAHVTG